MKGSRWCLIPVLFFLLQSCTHTTQSPEAGVLLDNGWHFLERHNFDSASIYQHRADSLSHACNYPEGIALAAILKGYIKCNLQSLFPESAKDFSEARSQCEAIGFQKGLSYALQGLGRSYRQRGLGKISLEYYISAMEAAKLSGNEKVIADAMYYLGVEYAWENKRDIAKKYYDDALLKYQQMKDTSGIMNASTVLGILYCFTKERSKAEESFSEVIRLSQEVGDSIAMAYAYYEVSALIYDGQRDSAQRLTAIAYQVFLRHHEYQAYINSFKSYALRFVNEGKLEEAKKQTQACINMSAEIGNTIFLSGCYGLLSEIYSRQLNYKEAFRYKNMQDSIDVIERDRNNTEIIQEKLAKYESDKQEAEIARQKNIRNSLTGSVALVLVLTGLGFMIYKRNRDAKEKQKEAEFNLQVSDVEMKALRAQMDPHFIFNSLNSINNFIQKNNTVDASEYLIKFARLVRIILENSGQKEVPLSEDLEALKLYMEIERVRLSNKFNFTIDVEEGIDESEIYVPSMMLQPLVENSIWHGLSGKKDPGNIYIRIKKENNMLHCEVEDDGLGRRHPHASDGLAGLASVTSTRRSMAMSITEERISILNKTHPDAPAISGLWIHDLPQGLRVELRLPYITEQ
jgi:tetratricopeptide (TPR) repeat protein